jgi:uncharacterized protein (TIGR00255 family)
LRLPEELRAQEAALRQQISARVKRGKVDCSIRFRSAAGASGLPGVDEEVLAGIVELAERAASLLGNPAPINPLELLRWPGVTLEQKMDMTPLFQQAAELVDQCLEQFVAARTSEGERLNVLLQERCEGIAQKVLEVRKVLPDIQDSLRTRTVERLQQISAEPDKDRLEQEMVYLAQKMDVAEELDRLEIHLKEIAQVLASDDAVGRRLDFLIQELNRESNTLSSKSQDIRTTQNAVDIKVLVEQMREQAQNIE